MAPTAPNPKVLAEAKRAETAARVVWKITVRGVEHVLHRADLGPVDARLVRQQAGTQLVAVVAGSLTGVGDLDTLGVLLWLARRHAGETALTYAAVEAELPSYEDIMNDPTACTIVVEFLDDDVEEDGSPEA